jgi:hypothetical protein
LRAPQARTTPTDSRRQLPMAARADGLIGHDDTLPQFRTDETSLPIRDLNARGVWCVGWLRNAGAGERWEWGVLGCVGGQGNWQQAMVTDGDMVGSCRDVADCGRGGRRVRRMVRRWRTSTRDPKRASVFARRSAKRIRPVLSVNVKMSTTPRRSSSSWGAWRVSTSGSKPNPRGARGRGAPPS